MREVGWPRRSSCSQPAGGAATSPRRTGFSLSGFVFCQPETADRLKPVLLKSIARAQCPSKIEVAHLVVGRRAKPHASLPVEIELPHRVFRLWERIFSHVPALRVKIPDHIQMLGRIP